MSIIRENMDWPPQSLQTLKMKEHSAWYSGEPILLANFYNNYTSKNPFNSEHSLPNRGMFWPRQIKNDADVMVHVPIASDICGVSADLLFSESPMIRVAQASSSKGESNILYKDSQKSLDEMLMNSGFYRKILEGAETGAALGGVYVKIAWDEELSPYPIPVVMQSDNAIPEFKFGILTAVTFWKEVAVDANRSKIYRLLERYERGHIINTLYLGTEDNLGLIADLKTLDETKDLEEDTSTVDALLAVYIPNMLPNRIDRGSNLGRSDLLGIESLMDSLDEIFTSWIKDIILAQAKLLLPESYLAKNEDGLTKYNLDKYLYVKLDIDPVSNTHEKIIPQQFDIRAEKFEKSSINFLERIITSAGYSPQSFGLNIEGRAESGTALSIRQSKSYSTKSKKENYWQSALKRIVELMILVYDDELGGTIEVDCDINAAFSDSLTNSLSELSNSVKMISDAVAASTETKVRLLHPDWEEEQILKEVKAIQDENHTFAEPPEGNKDTTELFTDGDENNGDE